MVLVLPTLFHVALLATVAPFTPTNAGGSTYVFTITGPWGEPTCQISNSQALGLEEILNVFEDEATCDDCLEDLDGDELVGVSDVLRVIADW